MATRTMRILLVPWVLLVTAEAALPAVEYCLPDASCWPSTAEWDALNTTLEGRLFPLSPETDVPQCLATGTDGTKAAETAHGACMPNRGCWYEQCDITKPWHIPSYSVAASGVADVQAALEFANQHNIAVSIKSTGHGYAGSAMMYGTLMIWTFEMPQFLEIDALTDSCGTTTDDTLKVGGGVPWGDVFATIRETHDIVSGGSVNVGAAGGWLAGGGLAAMSRLRGLGIDNALAYEVVLANGSHVTADACTHPDLFWALRGGGGGTWGVVTTIWYRLWEKTEILHMTLTHESARSVESLSSFITFLVDEIEPTTLDTRWGGYWSPACHSAYLGTCLLFTFWGPEADARSTLLDKVEAWANDNDGYSVQTSVAASFVDGQYGDGEACGAFMDCSAVTACEKWGVVSASAGNDPSYTRPSSWMLPKTFWEDKTFAKETLTEAISVSGGKYCSTGAEDPAGMPEGCVYSFGGLYTGYILGGAVNEVGPDAMGVNPLYRNSGANILSLFEPSLDGGMAILRQKVNSTPCFNHDGYPSILSEAHWQGGTQDTPDATPQQWQGVYWGAHVAELEAIKLRYDPQRRFNCYQCIGYSPVDASTTQPNVPDYDEETWVPTCAMSLGWILIYTAIAVVAAGIVVGIAVGCWCKNKNKGASSGSKKSPAVKDDIENATGDQKTGGSELREAGGETTSNSATEPTPDSGSANASTASSS